MNTTCEWGHDWRKSRVPGLHLIELAWERRPGEWFALHVALLGVWGTWTIYWRKPVPVESLGREHAP